MSTPSIVASAVREAARAQLAALAGKALDEPPIETVLMSDRHYRGRTFAWGAWLAMWLPAEHELRVYRDGELARAAPLDAALVSRAA